MLSYPLFRLLRPWCSILAINSSWLNVKDLTSSSYNPLAVVQTVNVDISKEIVDESKCWDVIFQDERMVVTIQLMMTF